MIWLNSTQFLVGGAQLILGLLALGNVTPVEIDVIFARRLGGRHQVCRAVGCADFAFDGPVLGGGFGDHGLTGAGKGASACQFKSSAIGGPDR